MIGEDQFNDSIHFHLEGTLQESGFEAVKPEEGANTSGKGTGP